MGNYKYNHIVLYNYYSRYRGGESIPKLIEIDIEFYYTDKRGGEKIFSEDIAKKVHEIYVPKMKNFIQDIKFVNDKKIQGRLFNFSIEPFNKGKLIEPLYNSGTYTAVYIIKDEHNRINDSIDNKYILRLYDRITGINMFNDTKIKLEYEIFNEFLSKIYYYGSIPSIKFRMLSEGTTKSYYKNIIDYNITKKYNMFNEKTLLTNQQKYDFLLSNLDMLHTLVSNNYIHTDYKLTNVGWEDNENMNVILIDYDYNTLLELNENKSNLFKKINKNINLDVDNMVSTYIPKYLSSNSFIERKNIFDINEYNKYSVGGLINVIENLNIEYNFNKLISENPPFIDMNDPMLNIYKLDGTNICLSLRLYSDTYEFIPTYEQLLNLFIYLGRNGHIKDARFRTE
jgi:hypothetical protein